MADKMLIDASHEEETRVVVVRGNRIEEFDFESQHKKQIRGNIYLAKVTRVEPSLQAAFVDYGGNRHGFLAFAEIHPDYYQIPLADRQALLRAEAEEHRRDEDVEHVETAPMVDLSKQDQPDVGIVPAKAPEAAAVTEETTAAEAAASPKAADEAPAKKARPRRSRKKVTEPVAETTATEDAVPTDVEAEGASTVDNEDDGSTGGAMAAMVETDEISEDVDTSKRRHDDDDDDDDHGEEEVIESVGAEDAMEEVPDRVQRKPRKQYRIQEVIKRRQILLVQVAKEERGNKGAALTTYLSRRPVFRLDAEHGARWRHFPQDHQPCRPQAPEGNRAHARGTAGHGRHSSHRRRQPHQGRGQARLRISDAPVGERTHADAGVHRSLPRLCKAR